jgi:hypothetical protein
MSTSDRVSISDPAIGLLVLISANKVACTLLPDGSFTNGPDFVSSADANTKVDVEETAGSNHYDWQEVPDGNEWQSVRTRQCVA